MSAGSRKGGQSARAKFDYISRSGKYAQSKEDPCLVLSSTNMPSWAVDAPADFWDAADEHERANARLFTQLEFSLPTELSLDEQQKLIEDFAAEILPNEPLTYAIHRGDSKNPDTGEVTKGKNPHCHLMFSQRGNDGHERNRETFFKRANKKSPEKGGAPKDRRFNFEKKGDRHSNWLNETRETWARVQNKALRENASGWQKLRQAVPQVDHRSFKDRGIDKEPTKHRGPQREARINRHIKEAKNGTMGQSDRESNNRLRSKIIEQDKQLNAAGAKESGKRERIQGKRLKELRRTTKDLGRQRQHTSGRLDRQAKEFIRSSEGLGERLEHAGSGLGKSMEEARERFTGNREKLAAAVPRSNGQRAGRTELRDQLSLRDFGISERQIATRYERVSATRAIRAGVDAALSRITEASRQIAGWVRNAQKQRLSTIRTAIGKAFQKVPKLQPLKPRKESPSLNLKSQKMTLPKTKARAIKPAKEVMKATSFAFSLKSQLKARNKQPEQEKDAQKNKNSRGISL